jgi:transposase
VASELIGDLERIYARKKAANKELTALLAETGTTLTDLRGIGPCGAARVLVEIGDHPAPQPRPLRVLERHRTHRRLLGRPGPTLALARREPSDQPDAALLATVQLRNPGPGPADFDRRKAGGKTSMEAMRALKRRLSNIVDRHLGDDATHTQ